MSEVLERAMPERPRLRSDIIVTRHDGAASAPFVAKDPETRQFFRFREPEHFIISQLDGERTLDEVRRRAEERFNAQVPEASLTAFVKRLQEFGLIDGDEQRPRPRQSRLQGNLFYLRFKLFDPDRLLTMLAKPLDPLFGVPFFVATLILTAFGLMIAASNTAQLGWDLMNLIGWEALIVGWVVVFVIGGIHEFAHGLACKRFGGQVHEIGGLLIFLMPGFYCDVSDAWLFPRKWQRLLVTAIGPYTEIVLWAGATVIWRITNPGTVPNMLALIVLGATGLKVMVNLNPLLKLDGYYLLSDALGIPNLRQRSFDYLKGLVTRRRAPSLPAEMPWQEHVLYFTYGLLALVFSYWLLWIITMHLGESLLPRYQAWGFLAVVFLLAVRLRFRILALLGKPTLRAAAAQPIESLNGALRSTLGRWPRLAAMFERVGSARNGSDGPPAPPAGNGRRAAPPSSPWRKGVALAVILVVIMLLQIELRLGGEFRVLPTTNADVRAEIEGLVSEVLVQEGMTVKAGQLVARLADRDILAELRKTEAAIAEKQAGIRVHEAGLQRDQTVAAKAEQRLYYRNRNLRRMQVLRQRDFIATKDLEQAEEDAAVREKELAEALVAAGGRREEIVAAAAERERLQTQAQYLKEQLRLTHIHARIDGIVTTPERQLRILIGQNVKKGDLLASVHQLDTVTAEIALSERDIGEIVKGQYVAVRARAYPNTTFAGKVTSVAAMVRTPGGQPLPGPSTAPGVINAGVTGAPVEDAGGDRVVLVTTEIENGNRLLKPEMTGRAKIAVGDRSIFSIITRRLARVVRVEFWSWW